MRSSPCVLQRCRDNGGSVMLFQSQVPSRIRAKKGTAGKRLLCPCRGQELGGSRGDRPISAEKPLQVRCFEEHNARTGVVDVLDSASQVRMSRLHHPASKSVEWATRAAWDVRSSAADRMISIISQRLPRPLSSAHSLRLPPFRSRSKRGSQPTLHSTRCPVACTAPSHCHSPPLPLS